VKWAKEKLSSKYRMENLGLSSAQQNLMDSFEKETTIQRKIEEMKKQIKIQEGAFQASLPELEKDKTYCYYHSEKQRVNKKLDNETAAFDSKISTLDARKKAFIEEIDSKIAALEARKKTFIEEVDSKMEKIESDKKTWQEKLDDEALRYEKEMERVREKIENAVPTSLTYRKLKQALTLAEEEEKVAVEERRAAHAAYERASAKAIKQAQAEADRQLREAKRLEQVERDAAVAAWEARMERENRESLERAKAREAAKMSQK